MDYQPVLIIVGPTAVGKSAAGIELAKLIDGEIISGDSMQVYKDMDIGTAKVPVEQRQGIPHHLLDIISPEEEFSVALFETLAEAKIKDIYARNKKPIIVGGTGLYIKALTHTYDFTPFAMDWQWRKSKEKEATLRGTEALWQELAAIDPVTANKLHPNDLKRIIRALEVYHFTGKPISYYQEKSRQKGLKRKYLMYALTASREKLYERINLRVEQMLASGWIEEAQHLLDKYNLSNTASQAIGYKQIFSYLRGEITYLQMVEDIKTATRRYAKRQLNWLRQEENIRWLDVTDQSIHDISKKIAQEAAGLWAKM